MAWDACAMEQNNVLRWIECHPSTMSMGQGGAALLAIIVTIAVAFTIRWREETFPARNYRRRISIIIYCMAQTVRDIEWRMKTTTEWPLDRIWVLLEQAKVFGATQNDDFFRPETQAPLIELREKIKNLVRDTTVILETPGRKEFEGVLKRFGVVVHSIEEVISGRGEAHMLRDRRKWYYRLRRAESRSKN